MTLNTTWSTLNFSASMIQGRAGVGKTYWVNCIQKFAEEVLKKPGLVEVCAPTGSAALALGGDTIHGLLMLPIRFT